MARESEDSIQTSISALTDIEVGKCLQNMIRNWNVFRVLVVKSCLNVRRLWMWVLGFYIGMVLSFLICCAILRHNYPFQYSSSNSSLQSINVEIGGDWVLSGNATNGVVLIGYAPQFPIIEALMEEAERILFRNGLPPGIKEFQMVPFNSEYSMGEFIRKNHGVLQYAFAVSVPGRTYPKLTPVLDLISYIHDQSKCYKENYPPCPGDVYVAKVIMEAFMNAHSRKENNVTLTFHYLEEASRKRDPILKRQAVSNTVLCYTYFLSVTTWTVIYVLAAERERIELTLKRMGISLGLNYAANLVVLMPLVTILLASTGLCLSIPYFGNVPIITASSETFQSLFYIVHAPSLVSTCVLASVIFQKARNCVMLAFLVFMIFLEAHWNPPDIVKMSLCVHMFYAQRGLTSLMQSEKKGGMYWTNIGFYEASPAFKMILLLVSIPLHLLTAAFVVYLKNRWSQTRGWAISQRTSISGKFEQNLNQVEPLPEDALPRIVFDHVFTDETIDGPALHDITWVIGRGEVSVAMGLENSGRMRILSLLYGDIVPVSGSVRAFQLDCARRSKLVLRNLGISHHTINNLFMQLSVRDNFWLFSKLRYYCQNRQRNNVNELIKDAGLEDLLDERVSKLRFEDLVILNIALAFVGDSAVVVLENPTHDMEINQKMRVWNLIKIHSKGRTVLITTICMAEAQMIGDRVTIFVDGHIHCSGTVPYVKEVFGTGYILEIEKQSKAHSDTILQFCQSFVPESEILEDSPKRLVILLPCVSSGIEDLLDNLERTQHDLDIGSYDLQGSLLEDAFLNLTSGLVNSKMDAEKNARDPSKGSKKRLKSIMSFERDIFKKIPKTPSEVSHSTAAANEKAQEADSRERDSQDMNSSVEDDGPLLHRYTGYKLHLSRFRVLLEYRFLVNCRKTYIEGLQAMAIILLVLLHIPKSDNKWYFGEKVLDHRRSKDNTCPSFESVILAADPQGLKENADKRLLWDILVKTLQTEMPSDCSKILKCLPTKGADSESIEKCIRKNTVIYGQPEFGIQLNSTPDQPMNALLFASRRTPGKSLAPAMTAVMETFLRFATNDTKSKYRLHYRAFYTRSRLDRPPIAVMLSAVTIIIFIYVPYRCICRLLSGPALLGQLSGASPLATWTAALCTDMTGYIILAGVHYLVTQFSSPIYPEDDLTEYIVLIVLLYGAATLTMIYFLHRFFNSAMFGTVCLLAVIFLPAHFILDQSEENIGASLKTKYLLLPGYFLQAYFLQLIHNYFVEMYCPPEVTRDCGKNPKVQHQCCSDAMAPVKFDAVVYVWVGSAQLVFWTCALYLWEYHIHSKAFNYFFSRFKKPEDDAGLMERANNVSSANSVYSFIYALSHFPTTVSQIVNVGSFSKGSVFSGASRGIIGSLTNLSLDRSASRSQSKATEVGKSNISTKSSMSMHATGSSCVDTKAASGPRLMKSGIEPKGVKFTKEQDDQEQGMPEQFSSDDVLVIVSLKKTPMILDVSMVAVSGEVFCFVSMDSDVSSEILRCVVGKSKYNSGQILFRNKPFGWRYPTSPTTIGYCSEQETFSLNLTPREKLSFHCALRGVVNVKQEVEHILQIFKLTHVANMAPLTLSEGAHASYRVAVAMVGEPDIILLDRPLANLDPIGKVIVFNAINRARNRGKIVIMTSNSIDECANLASRVAIIVQGQVMIVSSPKGIRDRFSNSYSLTARLGTTDQQLVDILVPSLMQRFPNSEIFVDRLNYLHVLLPYRTESLADIFRLMASVKKHLMVTDFILSHTTMDNVIDALEKETVKGEDDACTDLSTPPAKDGLRYSTKLIARKKTF